VRPALHGSGGVAVGGEPAGRPFIRLAAAKPQTAPSARRAIPPRASANGGMSLPPPEVVEPPGAVLGAGELLIAEGAGVADATGVADGAGVCDGVGVTDGDGLSDALGDGMGVAAAFGVTTADQAEPALVPIAFLA